MVRIYTDNLLRWCRIANSTVGARAAHIRKRLSEIAIVNHPGSTIQIRPSGVVGDDYSALHKYLHHRQTAFAAYWVSFKSKNDKTNSIFRWIESKVALATRFICSLDSINNFPNRAFK